MGGVGVGAVGGVQFPAGLVPRRVVPAVILWLALLQIGGWGGRDRAIHHVFEPRAAVELGTVAVIVAEDPPLREIPRHSRRHVHGLRVLPRGASAHAPHHAARQELLLAA